MTIAKLEGAPAGARWTTRIAMFAFVLLATVILMHRFLGMATPVFLALLLVAFALAATAIGIGVAAARGIWQRGGPGTARVVVGVLVAGGILAWPLTALSLVRSLPEINDVTTSSASPPPFDALAAGRKGRANGAAYPADRFATLQARSYPDITTMEINRPVGETYDLVLEAVRREGMSIAKDQPPSEDTGMVGAIEAIDRTLILGFYDDVALRVAAGGEGARVDIRSASRFGRHDLGRNAPRVRVLMRGIVARLESTVPGAVAPGRTAKSRPGLKSIERRRSEQGADRKKASPRQ